MSLHDSSDGISEEVERQLQLAISAAALATRKIIAERHAALTSAHAHSSARADQLRAQLDRDRVLASARLQPIFDRAWWDHATPADVGEMWQKAQTWREGSGSATTSVFDRAADRIEQETRERWQLDVHDVTALACADNIIERDRLASDAAGVTIDGRPNAEPDQVDASDATIIAAAPGPRLEERYDTPERRERLRARMEAADVSDDAIQARLLADIAQGCPIADAVDQRPDLSRDSTRPTARTSARPQQRTR